MSWWFVNAASVELKGTQMSFVQADRRRLRTIRRFPNAAPFGSRKRVFLPEEVEHRSRIRAVRRS